MQIAFFNQGRGGFVAHKYRIAGLQSKFSVWFNRDGQAINAQRVDKRGRAYPVPATSPAWKHIERYRLAGLSNAREIEKAGGAI